MAAACHLEELGANAVYLMATAGYPFEDFLAMARGIKLRLKPETVLIADVGDRIPAEARMMKEAGFTGVYHALRLGEGKDTGLSPQARIDSLRAFQEAGQAVGTCVEPIGPEHTNEELAERIHFAASLAPAFSSAARRITIPGTELAEKYWMISELRMAQIVAITRLATGRKVTGNCTHEPTVFGAAAGANLFWAESAPIAGMSEKKPKKAEALPCRNAGNCSPTPNADCCTALPVSSTARQDLDPRVLLLPAVDSFLTRFTRKARD